MMNKMVYDQMCSTRTEKALRVNCKTRRPRGRIVMAKQQLVVVDRGEQEMYRVIFKQGKQFRGMGPRDRGRV